MFESSLTPEIARVFAENFEVYGVRKVWRQLQRDARTRSLDGPLNSVLVGVDRKRHAVNYPSQVAFRRTTKRHLQRSGAFATSRPRSDEYST